MQSLDDIMSGRGQPASEETTTAPSSAETATPAAPVDTGAARDDKGRFAAKQPEAPAEPGQPAEPAPQQPSGHVPIQALDAERGKRKEIEDRYDREMRELREQIARLSQPQTPAEPPKPPPSMWDDPDGYMQHQLSPFQQSMQEMRETMQEMQAIGTHGAEKVNAAKAAAEDLMGKPEGVALARELMASGNPFDNLVKWHQRQSTMTEIGGDLEAYKAKIRAEILAEMGNPPPAQPSPAAPPAPGPLPTAFAKAPSAGPRGGQEYGGPRALADIMKR